jgi:hypothetical protein
MMMNCERTDTHPARAGRVARESITRARPCTGKKTVAIEFDIVAHDLEVAAQAENIVSFIRAAVANSPMMPLFDFLRSCTRPMPSRGRKRWGHRGFCRRDATRRCRDLIKCGREGARETRDRVAWRRDSIFGAPKPFRADPSSAEVLAHASKVVVPARETGHLARMSTRSHPMTTRWRLGSTRILGRSGGRTVRRGNNGPTDRLTD